MLEFYNDEEEALKLLQNYAYNDEFPSNPNAHIYLYKHQLRHNASPAQLIKTLKVECTVFIYLFFIIVVFFLFFLLGYRPLGSVC